MADQAEKKDTAVTKAPEKSPTIVTVAGADYELKGLSVADGQRLYAALPADYQNMADQFATIAANFNRISELQLPEGMTLQQALTNYKNAITEGGGTLKDSAEPYLKNMASTFADIPGLSGAIGTAERVGRGVGLVGTAAGAASDAIASPFRFLSFLGTVSQEARGHVVPGYSAEQSRAFGAAYAAAMFHEGSVRQAMPMIDMPFNDQASIFWEHPLEASLAGMEYASIHTPLVKDAWPYIMAACKFVYSAVAHFGDKSGAKALNWDEALAEAKSEIAAKAKGDTSWRGLTEARLREGELDHARGVMIAAEEVAGVKTKDIADTIAEDKTFIGNDGNLNRANTENGKTELETNPNGVQQDSGDRVKESAGNIFGETGKRLANGELRTQEMIAAGAGLAGVGYVGKKMGAPALRPLGQLGVKGLETTTRLAVGGATGLTAGALRGLSESVPFTGVRAETTARLKLSDTERALKGYEADWAKHQTELDDLKAKPVADRTLKDKAGIKLEEHRVKGLEDKVKATENALPDLRKALDEAHVSHTGKVQAGGVRGWIAEQANKLSHVADKVEHLGDAALARNAAQAEALIGSSSGKIAVRASRFGKLASGLGRFARFIPGIGVIGTGAAFMTAEAKAADGTGLGNGLYEQLDIDYKNGLVSKAQYAEIRGLQTAYVGSGLGGFAIAGATEAAQNALLKMDPAMAQRYLPSSLLSDVGLVDANHAQHARANQQARTAFANVKDVHQGTPVPQGAVPAQSFKGVGGASLVIG